MTDAERFKKALQFLSNADDKVRMLKEIIELFCLDIEATQRPWVGLTDKEILADDVLRYYFGLNGGGGPVSKSGRKIVDAIEKKLKELNQ